MKKMVGLVAFAAAMIVGASAMAAPVDIFVRQLETAPGSGVASNLWTVGATAQVGVDTGNISLEVFGFTGRTLAALPQISTLDSQFVGGAAGATFQVTSLAGQDLIPQGQPELVLATLIGIAVPGPYQIDSGDNAFGFTAVNQALDTPLEYSLTVIPVPEPATMVLLGLGLAGLALVRRAA